MKISSERDTAAESFACAFGVCLTVVVLAFPVVIFFVYSVKMRRSWPDYKRLRQLNDPEYTKNLEPSTVDKLRKKVYDKGKHKRFHKNYGVLAESLNLRKRSAG